MFVYFDVAFVYPRYLECNRVGLGAWVHKVRLEVVRTSMFAIVRPQPPLLVVIVTNDNRSFFFELFL